MEGLLDFDGGPLTWVVLGFTVSAAFFFAGTETAYFSLQKPDRDRFERGTATQRQVIKLLARRAPLITTILLGNEVANTLIAAASGALFAIWFPKTPWLNLLVVPPILVLFFEITPKVIAFRYSTLWAQAVAWPFTGWFWFASPARVVFSSAVMLVQRLVGAIEEREGVAEEELLVYVDRGTQTGELDPTERDIIEAVFEFDELHVGRLMTPRPDVFSVPVTIAWDDLVKKAREHRFSRIVVTGSGPDDLVGVLLVKDLLKFRHTPLAGPKQLRSLLLPPVFVPASKPADAMLREFLERRFHMAFVVDEHGTFVGLVTLDDLLGELLGTPDEDSPESEIERTTPDALTVRASIDVEDFGEETGIVLPIGEYHTLGGFVFHQLGRLPRRGDVVDYGRHQFVVAKMEGRRVAELLVRDLAATPAPAPLSGDAKPPAKDSPA